MVSFYKSHKKVERLSQLQNYFAIGEFRSELCERGEANLEFRIQKLEFSIIVQLLSKTS